MPRPLTSQSAEKEKHLDDEKGITQTDEHHVTQVNAGQRQQILRKLDFHLLPIVSLLYLLSFLDRSNIGNARIAGMGTDLHLVGLKYNIAAAVFFIPYCLAEVPSNIALKLFRPSRWIPTIMVAWGLVMTLTCLVNNFKGLVIARFFLGLTEAGLFPGVSYYLSLWYPRSNQAMRVAIFFSAATIAGAFGGLLAYFIEKMDGIGGLHGWQWIFCLEGLMTVLVALWAYSAMHDYPETATFLADSERKHVIAMLNEDSHLSTHYDKKFIYQAFRDYKTYHQVAMYIGILIPIYAIALFTPTIVKNLGYSAARAQLLTVPPFVAGCISTIIVGILSDRYNLRGPFIIGGAFVSLIGYIVLYTQPKPEVAYVGAILSAVGVYPTVPVNVAWAGGNAGGSLKRGVTLAMVIGIGNLGGICSSFVYTDPPRFHRGHGTIMGFLTSTIILSLIAMWNYDRLNKQKIIFCAIRNIDESQREKFRDMGDDSPLFRYTI